MRRFSDSVQVRLQEREQSGVSMRPGSDGVAGTSGRSARSATSDRSGAGGAGGAAGTAPEAFIWRGRLYVVRGVLAQWRERRAWWHDALDAEEAQVRPGETLVAAASEQHVWRVEASPGWSFTPGVYDLAHDESPSGDRWSLVRVDD